MTPAISFTNFSARYDRNDRQAVHNITHDIAIGDTTLVVGASGSGKSTLLRSANGIVPHLTGGEVTGSVCIAGRDTRLLAPRDLCDVVGFVHQDPEAQNVATTVEREVAFGADNIGLSGPDSAREQAALLSILGIRHLQGRTLSSLSGGERQRVALASALATRPSVLILDEPTSQLDDDGRVGFFDALETLRSEHELTVLMTEHRVATFGATMNSAILLKRGELAYRGSLDNVLRAYSVGSPGRNSAIIKPTTIGNGILSAINVGVEYERGGAVAVSNIELELREGEIIGVVGTNGSGKSSLLRALAGLVASTGDIIRRTRVAYVPQNPNLLLSARSVIDELRLTQKLRRMNSPDMFEHWLDALGLQGLRERHPRNLSGGERQRVGIAAVAVSGAEVLLLDEPTRGIDDESERNLVRALSSHIGNGGAAVIATHDYELLSQIATRVITLDQGRIVNEVTI